MLLLSLLLHVFYIIDVMRGKRIDYAPRGYLNPNSLFFFSFHFVRRTKTNNGTNNNNTNYDKTSAETLFVPKDESKIRGRKPIYMHTRNKGNFHCWTVKDEQWRQRRAQFSFILFSFSQVDNIVVELSLPLIFKQSAYFPTISLLFEMKWNFKLEKIESGRER